MTRLTPTSETIDAGTNCRNRSRPPGTLGLNASADTKVEPITFADLSRGYPGETPYLDAKASESQKNALVQIFSGQAGGHPARLGSFIGEVLGVTSVAIDYEVNGKHRSLKVGDVASTEIEAVGGAGDGEVTVSNHPLCIAPGYPAVVAKSTSMRYQDHGYQWALSDRNGLYSPFSYQG